MTEDEKKLLQATAQTWKRLKHSNRQKERKAAHQTIDPAWEPYLENVFPEAQTNGAWMM